MSVAENGIRALLTRYLGRYGEPPREHTASAVEHVWQRLEPDVVRAPVTLAIKPAPGARWRLNAVAVAAAGVIVFLSAALVGRLISTDSARAVVESVDGSLYRIVKDEAHVIGSGTALDSGDVVRTNGGAGAMLVLADGSRVEMRSQSEMWLERADDGVRIRLNRGGIVVNAAKQRAGHLYVQTKDVTVSVIGTVFLVNAEEQGSRVTVIEGEVRVQQGETEQKLRPGEQVATNPLMESPPMRERIAWSRRAETLLALLQLSAVLAPAVQSSTGSNEEFDVASVRRTAFAPGGGRGTSGGGGGSLRPAGEPCGGAREMLEIDPRRFVVNDMTLHALIAAAYGLDCRPWNGADFLFGGPGWTRSDGFDIQALIPEGTPSYTEAEFSAGDAPHVQRMLQTLLADRFGLVLRHEMREMPVYALTLAKGGPKLGATITNRFTPFIAVWKEGDRACCEGAGPEGFHGYKRPIERLVGMLSFVLGRPVLNRTGLTGEFNFEVGFEWQDIPGSPARNPGPDGPREPGAPPPSTRSPATVLDEDLGLKLETTRAPVEVLVVERVARPPEN